MSATLSETSVHSLRALCLENEWLYASILPEPGAKLFDLIWKPSGRAFLWHNPRIKPQTFPIEANFDNYWCGGWDDGFPTCDGCEHQGENYPNLGELRSLRWQVDAAGTRNGDAVARLNAFGPISPVRAEKTVTLAASTPVITIDYRIEHVGTLPMDFIWGTHPALAAGPDTVLRIPARTGIVGLSSEMEFGQPGQRYAWPLLETPSGPTDMSRVRGMDAKLFCGHCATDLEAGWYAIEHQETGEGFLLQFSKDDLPFLWMWLVYGGWRGYHHVIVEPWTSYPVQLSEAVRQKTSRRLEPGATFVTRIRATIYGGGETLEQALKRMEES